MLYVFLTIVHILVCVFLCFVVLLQSGKGQDLASSFGGASSQTVFGSAGPATALSRATSAAAVIFMLTSLGLAIISSNQTSLMDSAPIPEAPAAAATPLPAEAPADVVDDKTIPEQKPDAEQQQPPLGQPQPAATP